MPELPEVETTRRGIEPHIAGRRLHHLAVYEPRLRWPVEPGIAGATDGQLIAGVRRRAKYLLIDLEVGSLLLHLGMSGSLRVLPADAPRRTHDHVDLLLDSGQTLRFNDPRRFGSLHWLTGEVMAHPLLAALGPEPLESSFDGAYLHSQCRGRRVAIKQHIMNSQVVVGVGNIYASEALFRAGIRPGRAAQSLTRAQCDALAQSIREVLAMAIRSGGTTLRDYVGVDGSPGYFRQKLYVYERADEPCRHCGTAIRHRVQGQRSTYYCTQCQS
jgi:formamidopyrimidine-DNA glycosylase